ncbi:uncharacterized protein LOC125047627 [Penaeus chinensis]|uniref:uncharacterized protein LOC125047627 n=1 Tax=Penaeus chinensis TaxID=139456 RepID=UPI001FB5F21F|nr:uncharacterized protein LOC125047627 [Penaeus chinensis]
MYPAGMWPEVFPEPPTQPGALYLVPVYSYCQTSCVSSQNFFLQSPPSDAQASEGPLENSGQVGSDQTICGSCGYALSQHEQSAHQVYHGGMMYSICPTTHSTSPSSQDATHLDQNGCSLSDISDDRIASALQGSVQDSNSTDDTFQGQNDVSRSGEGSLSSTATSSSAPAADAIPITANAIPTVTVSKAPVAASPPEMGPATSSDASDDRSVETDTLSPQGCGDNSGFGVYGSDGCWYPIKRPQKSNGSQGFNPASIIEALPTLPVEHRSSHFAKYADPFMRPPPPPGYRGKLRMLPPPRRRMPLYNHFHRLDLPTETLGRPMFLQSRRTKDQPCVEDLWSEHKKLLFRHLPDEWLLRAVHHVFKKLSGWTTFSDYAKVRFYCRECQDGWTSMHGMVTFSYQWDRIMRLGEIVYQISGQKCASCSPGRFEYPLWYPEEAQKVITNLYYKIAADVYGLQTPKYIRTRRPGTPVTRHNMNLCQGCSLGSCRTAPVDNAM